MENEYTDENGVDLSKAILLIDGAHGVYIPKLFAESFGKVCNLTELHLSDLSSPDNEHYWETWEAVLDTVTINDDKGKRHTLYQDGDLWAIPVE